VKKLLILIFFSIFVQSCGEIISDENGDPIQTKYEVVNNIKNHVKLISPPITNALDSSTVHQREYELSAKRRLLVKLVGFNDKQTDAIINDESDAVVVLTLKSSESWSSTDMSICPLTRSWAINATWNYYLRHRFSSRQWEQPGGDIDEDSCIQGELKEDNKVHFVINDWILNYQNSAQGNFGFAVRVSKQLKIYGDSHHSHSPQYRWYIR
jgi:hypothetical protein